MCRKRREILSCRTVCVDSLADQLPVSYTKDVDEESEEEKIEE